MTVRKIKKIARLRLSEISVVPDGDDPMAHIIVKRRPATDDAIAAMRSELSGYAEITKGDTMKTIEELTADLDRIEKSIVEKDAEIAKLKGELGEAIEKAKTAITERNEAIEKAKTAAPADDEEAILKALPAPARKILEDARASAAAATVAIEKMASEREIGAEVEIAKGFKVGKADDLGALLYRVRKGKTTDADHATLVDVLKQASTIAKDSPLFKSNGASTSVDADDPEAKLNAIAKDIMKAKPNHTFAQAYTEAMDANPDIYHEYIAKKRG